DLFRCGICRRREIGILRGVEIVAGERIVQTAGSDVTETDGRSSLPRNRSERLELVRRERCDLLIPTGGQLRGRTAGKILAGTLLNQFESIGPQIFRQTIYD